MMYQPRITGIAALFASAAAAQPCEPHWEAVGDLHGAGVAAAAIYDDGTGESLYAAGSFDLTPDTPNAGGIGRWDGQSWSALAGELAPIGTETARVLAVFDGSLYAGGALTEAGGQPASHIARWDGKSWSALGAGVDNNVRAIAGFDEDGDGPGEAALFVGGGFLNAGGSPARNIARWNGEAWTAVGGGVDSDGGLIRALLVWDDGTGKALYATGTFTSIGGVAANNIAKWDGKSWSALGEGITGGAGAPGISLAAWDGGNGKALYVGGEMTQAGGQTVSLCASWDGKAWGNVGGGIAGTRVRAVAGYDDGTGTALYCGGEFPPGSIARWNGQEWGPVDQGLATGYVLALTAATRPQAGLYTAGVFTIADPLTTSIALWAGCNGPCYADCDGSGPLDLFDFLCFVNQFNAGDAAADCDANDALDLFDFLCFVNQFNEGC